MAPPMRAQEGERRAATNGNPGSRFSLTEHVNGQGNLIIGYNERDGQNGAVRWGSHNLVIGSLHDYLSFGGLVAGQDNRIFMPFDSVSGGRGNDAHGPFASVSGGSDNTARGETASVSGGRL
jgi:hypothetical protein